MRLLSLIVLSFCVVSSVYGQAAWERINSPPGFNGAFNRFEDLEAVTPDSLWTISLNHNLYRSTNAGESWDSLDVGAAPRSLAFVSGQVGWIGTLSGSDVVLFETRDGGQTVTNISDRIVGNPISSLCGLFALDDEAVYGVGGISGGSNFVRTLDGGETWQSTDMSSYANEWLIDVHFFNRQRGIAVGGHRKGTGENRINVVILGTEDGGDSWEERFRTTGDDAQWGWKLSFPTPEVGYASVENAGKVIKTTDGGLTWTALSIPAPSLQGIGFITPQLGWAGGRSTPQVTTDGGLTWASDPSLGMTVNRFQFFGDTLGYAVANGVYRYRAGSTVADENAPSALPTEFVARPAYPNPFPERVLIPYALSEPAAVTLEVFGVVGRRVDFVERGLRPAGPDELLWHARDVSGQPLPPGVYLYRLRAGDATATGRVVKAGGR